MAFVKFVVGVAVTTFLVRLIVSVLMS